MTEEDLLLLDNLKANVSIFFSEYKLLEAKYNQLKQSVKEKENALKNLYVTCDELRERNKKLSIANQLLTKNNDDDMAKKKINTIIREIDKCIALLNK